VRVFVLELSPGSDCLDQDLDIAQVFFLPFFGTVLHRTFLKDVLFFCWKFWFWVFLLVRFLVFLLLQICSLVVILSLLLVLPLLVLPLLALPLLVL
jgi:hypothetical protein